MSRYEIKNDAVETSMKTIAERIKAALPPGWGFSLHLFTLGAPPLGQDGAHFYVSNADRRDVVTLMQEWIDREQQKEQTP